VEQRVRRWLYRRLGLGVICAGIFVLAMVAVQCVAQRNAQRERPPIAPEPKPTAKKEKGPRALGLLQLSSDGKATLIPIAILIDGRFYDASAYKANPVPMALDVGTVYEAESGGASLGLFTVKGALHSKSAGSQNPWVGTGAYLLNGSEPAEKARKAENVPVGMDDSGDAPPRLTRGDKAKPADQNSQVKKDQSSGTPKDPSTGEQKPAEAKPADNPAPVPSTPTSSAKPEENSSKDQGAGKTTAESGADAYRPTLRRGKPTTPLPDDDETPAKPASTKVASASAAATPVASGPVQLVPAVSDAGGPDPKSYKFQWNKGEEQDRRTQVLALANDDFRAYLVKRAKDCIPAKPAAKPVAGGHKPARPQPKLDEVEFRTFDVWGNNQPVIVFSAVFSTDAQIPTAKGTFVLAETPAATGPAARGDGPFWMMLVVRTDIYGNLRKLYLGITDKYHLDVTPRLELIDAVDADGDGRGEFLFRETSDAGSGYIIYRPTADVLWKMFDSLNPE